MNDPFEGFAGENASMIIRVADKADVLIVDEEPENLHLLAHLLREDFLVHPFTEFARFVAYIEMGKPADLILLDVNMPGRNRNAVCAWLRGKRTLVHVPIIFLGARGSPEDEGRGFVPGADDYISKPYLPSIVIPRLRHHVHLGRSLRIIEEKSDDLEKKMRKRTVDLERANTALQRKSSEIERVHDATIFAFTMLAETRDNETGMHLRRTQNYVLQLAMSLRHHPRFAGELGELAIQLLYKSAPMHDIGKVAIPDHILHKPDKLTAEEFEIMKTHTTHGRDAIFAVERSLGEDNDFLVAAREIAYGHHEKWDGSGYPQGLSGEDIPLFARIMAVADVYDALISKRVYKTGMPHATAVNVICAGRGSQFDPDVCDYFLRVGDQLAVIAARFSGQ